MKFWKNLKKKYKAYKVYRKVIKKEPKIETENLYQFQDEDYLAQQESRNLTNEKKRLLRRKAFLIKERENQQISDEISEMEADIYEQEEEQPEEQAPPQNMTIEQMFMTNVLTLLQKGANKPRQQAPTDAYPTGTTDVYNVSPQAPQFVPQQAPPQREESPIADEDIQSFLGQLQPKQREFLKQIPESTVLRARELL